MELLKKSSIIFFTACMFLVVGCESDDDDSDEYGNWVEGSSFDGDSRSGAASFTIGDKGYLVGGYDGDDYLSDTWEYNSEDDYWIEKATEDGSEFPGDARTGAVGFTIDGKGYVGTGYNGSDELLDFYEYDPETDSWSQKADFIGSARYSAIGFSINGKGYIGTGYDGSEQKDFYEYDPTTDTWEQIYGFGGEKRREGSAFVIDDIAYIGFGLHNGSYEDDFYSFDGTDFTQLNEPEDEDEDAFVVSHNTAFSLDGKGYIATGISSSITSQAWEYTPSTDSWTQIPNFEGTSRQDANAFSFDSKALVLMGRSGSSYFDDIWELRMDELEDDED